MYIYNLIKKGLSKNSSQIIVQRKQLSADSNYRSVKCSNFVRHTVKSIVQRIRATSKMIEDLQESQMRIAAILAHVRNCPRCCFTRKIDCDTHYEATRRIIVKTGISVVIRTPNMGNISHMTRSFCN